MISINIHKSTVVAFALGFALGFTRKVYVEINKAKDTKEETTKTESTKNK